MTFVPMTYFITKIMDASGCTRHEADMALRRCGYAADMNQLLDAAELEMQISTTYKTGIHPTDAMRSGTKTLTELPKLKVRRLVCAADIEAAKHRSGAKFTPQKKTRHTIKK